MRPITDILVEFPRIIPASLFAAPEEAAPEVPRVDPEAQYRALAAARQAGVEEARAAAEASWAERAAALAADHEQALADARARWAAEEGATLGNALKAGLAAIEAGIAGHLSSVLMPVLAASARARAAEAMRAALADLLTGGQGGLIEVRGPADLVAPIRAAFAGQEAVVVVEADEPELSARAGDTVIASQIEAWTSRLHNALAGEAA